MTTTLTPRADRPAACTGPDRPPSRDVQPRTRLLLAGFAGLTLLASNQLLVLGGQTDRWFAWTIHSRPTAAFLGAAYASGFVLSVLALRQPSWVRVRIAVATVAAFTALTLVATLVHAHRLHLTAEDPVARAAAWFWVAVYLVVPLACVVVIARQELAVLEPDRPRAARVCRPLPHWLRGLLAAQGAVLLTTGAVLFARGLGVHHVHHDVGAFWPWPLGPISAQVVGAWLVAFGIATVLVLRERDLGRMLVPAVAYTAFGVFQLLALLGVRAHLDATGPDLWGYVAVLATVVLAGGYGWWSAVRPATGAPS
jgi:hypothetical protein